MGAESAHAAAGAAMSHELAGLRQGWVGASISLAMWAGKWRSLGSWDREGLPSNGVPAEDGS